MPPAAALLPSLAAVLLLAAAGIARPVSRLGRAAAAVAAVPLALAGLLVAYVVMEDTYRRNGTSRWEAYTSPGGGLAWLLGLAVAALLLCAGGLAWFGLARRERVYRATALAGAVAVFVVVLPTVVGFSAN